MVNWISVRSLLSIASIHELQSVSIDFLIAFPQYDLDMDVFMELPLLMVVDVNRGLWLLKLNKSSYGLNQPSADLFYLLKMV